ncbi:MAG: DUF2493 domain-containing protein [Cytophagales bacterium]|nr:DUF2493 domain-containing protein [Cytophagales bacterium]
MKIIIAGSRDFNTEHHYRLLNSVLSRVLRDKDLTTIEIVSGTARGADKFGERYANENNIAIAEFPADWNKHGKSAGYIRNSEMADYGSHLIAFWDGKSRGTKHMIDLATKKNLKVIEVIYDYYKDIPTFKQINKYNY